MDTIAIAKCEEKNKQDMIIVYSFILYIGNMVFYDGLLNVNTGINLSKICEKRNTIDKIYWAAMFYKMECHLCRVKSLKL